VEPGALSSSVGVLDPGFVRLLVRGRLPDLAQSGAAARRQLRVAPCCAFFICAARRG
jgi:hypothetical protein